MGATIPITPRSRDEQIKIGSKNFRVTEDHKADLMQIRAAMPSVTQEQIVLLTSAIGSKIFLSMIAVTGLYGTNRDRMIKGGAYERQS
jgi:hypothetical protein